MNNYGTHSSGMGLAKYIIKRAFQDKNIKLMPVSHSSSLDRLLDYIPDLMEKTNNMMNRIVSNKKEETEKILKEMQKRNSKDINKVENEVKDIKKEVDSKKMEEENNQDD